MASLFLAQLAENAGLLDVFSELLSNEGNELYLKSVSDLCCEGTYTIRELRRFAFDLGFIMLGIKDANNVSVFNQPLDTDVTLTENDSPIVLA